MGGDESREVTGDWMAQGPEGHSKHLRFCSARNGELLKNFKREEYDGLFACKKDHSGSRVENRLGKTIANPG